MLGLSILPTLRCNFRCTYCYEEHLNIDMEDDVRRNLLRFVEQELPGKRELNVNWCGGEPLLRLDLIGQLSSRLLQLCEEHAAKYEAQVTTNGFLLTRSAVGRLAKLGVRTAQVTLDGPPEAHNRRRVLPDGGPTFATILDHILDNADLIEFRVRVNIDPETAPFARELLDFLEPVSDRVILGFYPVSLTPRAIRCGIQNFPLSTFSQVHRELFQGARERGFRLARGFALCAAIHCGAYQLNTHVIDPRGDAFNCVEDVGYPEKRIGHLTSQGEIRFDYPRMPPWARYGIHLKILSVRLVRHSQCVWVSAYGCSTVRKRKGVF